MSALPVLSTDPILPLRQALERMQSAASAEMALRRSRSAATGFRASRE